jgi:hypothetical protein
MIGGLPADEARWAIDESHSRDMDAACWAHEAEDGKAHPEGHGIHPFAFVKEHLHLHELGDHLKDHPNPPALNGYPCQLPDGRIGRTSFSQVDGRWVAVCVLEA